MPAFPLPLLLASPHHTSLRHVVLTSSYSALPLESLEINRERCLPPSYEGAFDGPIPFQCTESKVEGSEGVCYAQPLQVIHQAAMYIVLPFSWPRCLHASRKQMHEPMGKSCATTLVSQVNRSFSIRHSAIEERASVAFTCCVSTGNLRLFYRLLYRHEI